MKRKDFIKTSLLTAATGLIAACTTDGPGTIGGGEEVSTGPNIITNKKYRWKMVTTWPPKFPVLGESADLFAKWVKEMSGGRLEIQVYGGGELVPPLEAFDAVSGGTADIGSGAAYYWAGKEAAAQFFAAVPFGMNAQQISAWIISGGGLELWRELYAPYNLVPFAGGNTGVQMGGWFNREINSIEDLKGLKMRIPGLGGKVLAKAGGAAILVAGGEIYTSLERGVIDATEWIGPYHDYKMGFHKIAKYYYTPGWHETGSLLEFFVNKQRLESLPLDLQAIVEAAAFRAHSWVLAEFDAQNGIFLEKLIKEEKVEVRNYPQEVLGKLREYTKLTLEEITANDPKSKKIYEAYRKFHNRINGWSKITEQAYYNNIMQS